MATRTKAIKSNVRPSRILVKSVKLKKGKRGKETEIYPMVLKLTNKHWKGDIGTTEYQDAIGAALLAAAETPSRFDPSFNAKMSTIAHFRIQGAVLDLRRKELLYQQRNTFVDPTKLRHIREERTSLDGRLSNKIAFEKVMKILETKMNSVLSVVLVRHFMEGVSDKKIAKEIGCDPARIPSLIEEALKTVRSFLTSSGPPKAKPLFTDTDN